MRWEATSPNPASGCVCKHLDKGPPHLSLPLMLWPGCPGASLAQAHHWPSHGEFVVTDSADDKAAWEHLQQPMPHPCSRGKDTWAPSCCDSKTSWTVYGVCATDFL